MNALMKTRISFGVGLLLVLAAAGCQAPQTSEGTGERKQAPPLVLQKIDGSGNLSLAEQRGKVVLVDLWATWCAPCITELPHLQTLSETYSPDDFLMLGIVLESGKAEEVQEFVAKKEISYPQVMGEDGTKESFGPFLGYPTKYLIDREGRVVKRYFGMVGEEVAADVEQLIETGSIEKTTG